MSSDSPTNRPPSGQRKRLSGVSQVTPRVANAISEIERSLSDALVRRVTALFDEERDRIRMALMKEQLSSYEDGKRQAIASVSSLVEAYLSALHQKYAEEIHRMRPGLEITTPSVMSSEVARILRDTSKLDVTDKEAAELMRKLRLPIGDDIPDV